jgi:hypothetical protein
MRRWKVGIGGWKLLPGGNNDEFEVFLRKMISQRESSDIIQSQINLLEYMAMTA